MCLSHAHSLCETSHNPTRTLPERAFIHFCQNAASILARVELMKLEHHLANPAARSRQALLTADAVSQAEGNHPTHVGVPKTQRWSPIERTRGSDRPIDLQTRHFICLLPTPRIVSLDRGGVSNLPEGDFAKIPSAIFYKKNLPFSPFGHIGRCAGMKNKTATPACGHRKCDRELHRAFPYLRAVSMEVQVFPQPLTCNVIIAVRLISSMRITRRTEFMPHTRIETRKAAALVFQRDFIALNCVWPISDMSAKALVHYLVRMVQAIRS